MKNSKELKELRSDLISELESIKVLAETETRDLTKKENEKVDILLSNIDDNDIAITRSEKIEDSLKVAAISSGAVVSSVDTDKATRGWSLFKAVNEIRNGGVLTGLEAEMHQQAEHEGRKGLQGIGLPTFMTEKRAISQAGSAIAPSVVAEYVDTLQATSLYNRLGVNDLGTVTADTILPIAGNTTVNWATENAATADTGADFVNLTLTPKRVSGVADISNVLLMQNGAAAEASVMREMGRNFGLTIDAAMFSSAAAVAGSPTPISQVAGVLTPAMTGGAGNLAANMGAVVQAYANSAGLDGNLAFVNNWNMYSGLKSAAQVNAVSPLYTDDRLLGFPGFFTSATATGAGPITGDGIFGDWSRLYFATFGPSNIIVDGLTQAASNNVRLVMNNHVDFGVATGASFAIFTAEVV